MFNKWFQRPSVHVNAAGIASEVRPLEGFQREVVPRLWLHEHHQLLEVSFDGLVLLDDFLEDGLGQVVQLGFVAEVRRGEGQREGSNVRNELRRVAFEFLMLQEQRKERLERHQGFCFRELIGREKREEVGVAFQRQIRNHAARRQLDNQFVRR